MFLIVLVLTQGNELPHATTLLKHAVNAQFNLANTIYAWNDESSTYDIAFRLLWKFVNSIVLFGRYTKRYHAKR